MNSIAFSVFGVDVAWYGIILTGAIALGCAILIRTAPRFGYSKDDMYDLILWVVPTAIVVARLYYVVFEWEYYRANPIKILAIREGGLAIHGAVLGGLLGGWICCRIKKLHFADLADLVAVPLILGQAIGRWGNFVNQEAHGGPTDLPWGILVDGVKVHPTFLYESLWNVAIFVVLLVLFRKRKFYGQIFLTYMVLYSVGRFWIEGLRTDSLMVFGLRTAQLVSLAAVVGGSIWYRLRARDPRRRVEPPRA